MKKLLFLVLLLASVGAAGPSLLTAQVVQSGYNPRDDQYRMLGLVRAESEYRRAADAFERAKQLHESGAISTQELENTRAAYERARVDYMQQSLAVVFAAPHVVIDRAVKSRTPDGGSYVRIALRNTTAGGVDAGALSELLDPQAMAQLRPTEISNVYVSLKAEPGLGGTIISSPYEQRIPAMRVGQPATVGFRLLRDFDEVVVSVNYADKAHERKIFLEMDASAEMVTVQSIQFSQEADLGGQVAYDLRLERFTSYENNFRLAVVGLPRDVQHEFRDPQTGARLNQVRFPGGETQRNLQLVLSLPQRASEALQMDEAIQFWVLALDEAASGELSQLNSENGTAGVEELQAGKSRLELVPRGIGRIQVRAANLYHEIRASQSVSMDVVVRNAGSRTLHNVRVRLDAPTNWEVKADPEFINELPVNGDQRVALTLTPPADVVVGDYEAKLRTESAAADRRVEVDDKTIRIHVASEANWIGTSALTFLLLGMVGGIVAFGIRLSRR